jgi:glycosyltransferase involved in cell wall biosynthesis
MQDLDKHNLSICIAAYNRPELLKDTLDSIAKLDAHFDIHIIDDKSPRGEEIEKVVARWTSSYSGTVDFIRNSKNLGEVETKRLLFERVKTEYLMLLGDDDTLVKSNFDRMIQSIAKSKERFDLELFGYNVIDERNAKLKTRKSLCGMSSINMNHVIRKYFMRHVTFPFYYFHPALYIIKSDVAKNLDLDPAIGIGEDYDLFIRIMNSSNVRWRINPIVIFNWRKHNKESKNQSSDVKKRFETKYLIISKHYLLDLKRFWILDIPLWFDEGYSLEKKKLEELGYSQLQRFLVSKSTVKFAILMALPFYNIYKLSEYALIQTLFILYGRDHHTRI